MSNTHTNQFKLQKLGAMILGIVLAHPLVSFPTNALDLGNGQIFFERSPRLIRSATSFRGPQALAYYYFTIALPEDTGAALQTVTIVQQPNLQQIFVEPEQTKAFLEDSSDESSVPIKSVTGQLTGENGLKIIFEQPIQPGQTVTIALRVVNPLYGGIYQFGITAYPVGENSQGLYLGVGRIQLSSPGGRG